MTERDAEAVDLDLGPLPSLVGYTLRRAQLAVFADFHREFEGVGLRPAEFSVLVVLRHNPGARASQVAQALGIRRANFTALLQGLQSAGLVERRTRDGDARATALQLSAAGAARLAQADAASIRHEARWAGRLGGDELSRLLAALHAIAG